MSNFGHPPSTIIGGETIAGRYQLERLIGKGGMAEVWSAYDIELGRRVAVKWLKPSLASDPVVTERFRREAMAGARLNHPNIVGIHDVVEFQGRQVVVMQLVDGKSLRTVLDNQQRLGPELTIHIGAAIASALDAAHKANFIHRDVKPANILVTSDGRVLLTDFGIAKAIQSTGEDLTSDNVMMGTAKYLSPEQVRGRPLDGRADIYSLGLVLYECLAGRVPFIGESDADTALARLQRDPTDLGHLRPTVPIGLVNLIHRTLARNPAHRPQSGSALRAALLGVDAEPPVIDATPSDPPLRQRFPPRQAAGAGPGVPGEPGRLSPGNRPAASPRKQQIPASPTTVTARQPEAAGRSSATQARSKNAPASPTQVQGRPAANATDHADGAVRDATPPARGPIRGVPARGDQQRLGPTRIVVASLVGVALVVVALLVVRNLTAGQPPQTPAAPPAASLAPGSPAIASFSAYDPGGDNGSENDSQAALAAADGVDTTFWATECYQNEYLGGKAGVGLVVNLTTTTTGTISFQMLSAPYQVQIYASADLQAPATLEGWTSVGDVRYSVTPGTITADVDVPSHQILIWVRQLGDDSACSTTNPYRGRIGEVTFDSRG